MIGRVGYQYWVLVPLTRAIIWSIDWMILSSRLVTIQELQVSYETKFQCFSKIQIHWTTLESWFVYGYWGIS